jgi:putative oxidoreductase
MLLPLIFGGGGRFSLDHLLATRMGVAMPEPKHGPLSWAIAAAVFAIPFLMLIPTLGIALLVVAIALAVVDRMQGRQAAPAARGR